MLSCKRAGEPRNNFFPLLVRFVQPFCVAHMHDIKVLSAIESLMTICALKTQRRADLCSSSPRRYLFDRERRSIRCPVSSQMFKYNARISSYFFVLLNHIEWRRFTNILTILQIFSPARLYPSPVNFPSQSQLICFQTLFRFIFTRYFFLPLLFSLFLSIVFLSSAFPFRQCSIIEKLSLKMVDRWK